MTTAGPGGTSGRRGMPVQVLPVGHEGLLLEVADLDAVLALDAAVRAAIDAVPAPPLSVVPQGHAALPVAGARPGSGSPWQDVTDVVPAARTVLLVTREGADLAVLRRAVLDLAASLPDLTATLPDLVRLTGGSPGSEGPETAPKSHEVEIAVRYDGPDLADVAALTGLSPAEVVAAHTGTAWRVAFGGFAPGFAYLVGGDPRLHVPRRERPRPTVSAGSVGLAGEFSGIYPRTSPGGWQLLGTTDAPLWDADRDPPALLRPGTVVRFTAIEGSP